MPEWIDNAKKLVSKMKGGTPNHSECSLCVTCSRGTVTKGLGISQEMTYCHAHERPIRFHVTECSSYTDKRMPDLYDMKAIAWMLVTKKAGREIGFVSARDFKNLKSPEDDE